jgi:flagella basal body P-ring formation protein FlgA
MKTCHAYPDRFGRLARSALTGLVLGIFAAGAALAAEPLGWRLKLKEAAVVAGPDVLLGEIAAPVGEIAPEAWARLAPTRLWPSPPEGRPMNMTRPRLQQGMAAYAGELSALCLYPGSMTLQRGGAVLDEADLRALAVKTLTPLLRQLPGDNSMQDFRLPGFLFLSHARQKVELEGPLVPAPGRMGLRFAVRELDGSVVKRATGSVFVDSWAEVPCAASPLNKDELLGPERVSFARRNLAQLRDAPWDGRGGPWRVMRAIGTGQPIAQSDLRVVPTVRKGAPVTMVYQSGALRLTAPGEALSDGAAGESIAVRNLQSKKQLQAIVRDGLTVVVR